MVIDRIKIIQERTGVNSIDIVSNSSSSSSSWSGGKFTITGSHQAVKEASAIIREIMQEGYRALDLQEEAYDTSRIAVEEKRAATKAES
eukprot:4521275-Heterocapsa_arctica.AAC.1